MNRLELALIRQLKTAAKPLGSLRIVKPHPAAKATTAALHELAIRKLIALVDELIADDCCFSDLIVSGHGEFLCFACYNMDDEMCLQYIWSPVASEWELIDVP